MVIYSYVEECYCTICGQNVAIKVIRDEEGNLEKNCLNKCCDEEKYIDNCKIK